MSYFEIVDEKGVIESPLGDLSEALLRLEELKDEEFEFKGEIKIIQVHYRE